MLIDQKYTAPYRLYAASETLEASAEQENRVIHLYVLCDGDKIELRKAAADDKDASISLDLRQEGQAAVHLRRSGSRLKATGPERVVLHWLCDALLPRSVIFKEEPLNALPSTSREWRVSPHFAAKLAVLTAQYSKPAKIIPFAGAKTFTCASGVECLTEMVRAEKECAVVIQVDNARGTFDCATLPNFASTQPSSWGESLRARRGDLISSASVTEEMEKGSTIYVLIKANGVVGFFNFYSRLEKFDDPVGLAESLTYGPAVRAAVQRLCRLPIKAYQRFRYKMSQDEIKAALGLAPPTKDTKRITALDRGETPAVGWAALEDPDQCFALPVARCDFGCTILEP